DWADYANEHLKKAGLDIEIDHRSHKERGLAATPTIKLGVAATALERKGIRTEKGDINRIIQQSNLEIHELHNTELPAKTVKLPVTATTKDNVLQAVIGDYRNTEHFALDASLRAGFIE
ncbi:MobA/MobL family protein, partial [Streptococcus pneumoniae]|uniref:MobA/MobL family protein n=1 Tax=Streptococcus pneumoniae TaxID=1313 RepID=UPI0013DC1DCF